MRFYRLFDDVHFPKRWYLGDIDDINAVDNWAFVHPGSAPPTPKTVAIYEPGRAMDFSLTEAFGVPIVSANFKDALHAVDGVRFLPISIRAPHMPNDYFVLYVEHAVACVDETRSEFEKFTVDDPVRPDLAGNYRAFFKLVIDEQRASANGRHIFRLTGAPTHIIVDELVRKRITDRGLTGATFKDAW